MRLPLIQGLIKRRLLVNYRVDPEVLRRVLPEPLKPKLQNGHGVAGICLIRLEDLRPPGVPAFAALASENAAHRIAVEWEGGEGVYIVRRDTNSLLTALGGGRLFPGEQHRARFDVKDDGARVDLRIAAHDGGMTVELRGHTTAEWPKDSCFANLAESSAFFEGGSVGYSVTHDAHRLDGLRLETKGWAVRPFAVEHARSSFFEDAAPFPAGSVVLDHALVMRDLRHEWHPVDDLAIAAARA